MNTTHSTTFYIKDNPYQPCSTAIQFYSKLPYRLMHSTISTFKTGHICHAQYSNHIAATYSIKSLPMHINKHYTPNTMHPTACTSNKHKAQLTNGTRCRDGVKLLWCKIVVVSFPFSFVHEVYHKHAWYSNEQHYMVLLFR